jgi:hypothetical protein
VRPYVENRVRVVPHSLIVLVLIALAQHTYCAAGHDGMQRAGSARVCVCVRVCGPQFCCCELRKLKFTCLLTGFPLLHARLASYHACDVEARVGVITGRSL